MPELSHRDSKLHYSVNCLPVMCADARYIPHLCSSSLGGPLRTPTLAIHGETQTVISPLSFKSMNFHLYLFHLLSRCGSEEQRGGCCCIYWNGSRIHRRYKELRPQRPWLMRKTISRLKRNKWKHKKKEICFITPAEEVFRDQCKASHKFNP